MYSSVRGWGTLVPWSTRPGYYSQQWGDLLYRKHNTNSSWLSWNPCNQLFPFEVNEHAMYGWSRNSKVSLKISFCRWATINLGEVVDER